MSLNQLSIWPLIHKCLKSPLFCLPLIKIPCNATNFGGTGITRDMYIVLDPLIVLHCIECILKLGFRKINTYQKLKTLQEGDICIYWALEGGVGWMGRKEF